MSQHPIHKFFKISHIFIMAFFVGVLLLAGEVKAGAGDNIFGWAWSDNVGWISFNNLNHGGSTDYGVKADREGNFSGEAWSDILGYLRFDPPDYSDTGQYPADPQHGVRMDNKTGIITGWARFCNDTDDPLACESASSNTNGWVKMHEVSPGEVFMDKANYLHGYGYSSDYGWISFNCKNKVCADDNNVSCDDSADCATGECVDACNDSLYRVGATSTVSGYAWNGQVGWISMNCGNPGAGGCGHLYGVNVDPANLILGGYAWSNQVGWISFEEVNPPDVDYDSQCKDPADCDPAAGCTACLDPVSKNIYGWGKILNLGDDEGWIRFDDDDGGDGIDFGVAYYPDQDNEVHGWAYNGGAENHGIGWISHWSGDCDINDNGYLDAFCGGDDATDAIVPYVVRYDLFFNANSQPTVDSLTTIFNRTTMCNNLQLHYSLGWSFSDPEGDTQEGYRVEIDDNSSFISPLVREDLSGTIQSVSFSQAAPYGDTINYNTTYYWRVRVKDDAYIGSKWSEWSAIESTTTPRHQYPQPDFDWTPNTINEYSVVLFDSEDMAEYYTAPYSASYCSDGNDKCSYLWEVSGSSEINEINIVNPTNASTTMEFGAKADNLTISLTVTEDEFGYSCTEDKIINMAIPLPSWIETR